MHRTAAPFRTPCDSPKDFRDKAGEIAAPCEIVTVRAMSTPHIITIDQRRAHSGRDGFLPDAQMTRRLDLAGFDERRKTFFGQTYANHGSVHTLEPIRICRRHTFAIRGFPAVTIMS